MYKYFDKCRACGSPSLFDVFSLGEQYVTDFPEPGCEEEGLLAPLDVALCVSCSLLQLRHSVERDFMYKEYWYKSGMNQTMRDALADIVNKGMSLVALESGDKVIDIGSNDGTLLSNYPKWLNCIAYEPARNIWKESVRNYPYFYKSYNDYFSYRGHQAKIITTVAMFYDLDDPSEFIRHIYVSLDRDGIWINQQNYLVSMLENHTFDNISHEHVAYYSLRSLEDLLDRNNLQVIDVELNDINGGSFRTYIARKGANVQPFKGAESRVAALREREAALGLGTPAPYTIFFNHINQMKKETHLFIENEVANGKSIYLYGASTRGHVILQFYGLDHTLIVGAAERNPDKYGLVTIGTGIPIMSEEEVRAAKPDYMLVLPYAFRNEFIQREEAYLKGGGSLIFPLPNFEVVRGN